MTKDNTQRFSDRVEDYVKYRPAYPSGMINILEDNIGLNESKVIADIGSGTGLSSLPFLKNNNLVFGVEPNQEMRAAQEQLLQEYPNFKSIDGTAEQTTLADHSVDVIFCGQAFHWFDPALAKQEFSRILKKDGHIVLAWNSRTINTDFLKEYEQILIRHIEGYPRSNHRNDGEQEIRHFFSPKSMNVATLDNQQLFDLAGLKGRLKSSSYCPKSGKEHENLMQEINRLFAQHQSNYEVTFRYETKIFWC